MYDFSYDSHEYFFDLLAFSFLLLPCFFLPVSALARRLMMIVAGMYMIYFIAPRLVVFYLAFWVGIFLLHRLIAFTEKRGGANGIFWATILIVLSPLVCWKVLGDTFSHEMNIVLNNLFRQASQILWELDMASGLVGTIGLSFATFRALDLLIKTYLGKLERLRFDEVMFYGFFPPVQIVGPIIEYEEIARLEQKPDSQKIYEGLLRIASGFFKIFLLAGALKGTVGVFGHTDGMPIWQVWLNLIGYSWYFYLNFSGYSDLSIGIAKLYGFDLKENFNFPFFKRNIKEFWNSWHMSLSRFAQRNIFIPCGGYRAGTQYVALLATMMTIALWHDISIPMVLYGLYHFTGLTVQRHYAARTTTAAPSAAATHILHVLLTYLFVLLSFPLIPLKFGELLPFYKALVGM